MPVRLQRVTTRNPRVQASSPGPPVGGGGRGGEGAEGGGESPISPRTLKAYVGEFRSLFKA